MEKHRILILGGGFAGIRTALDLEKKNLPNTEIILISDKHHFEFTPAHYKLAVGRSPKESCIPLYEIFKEKKVSIIIDSIIGGDLSQKSIYGASGARYRYDTLFIALGSELAYFNIPGIEERSFNIKTVENALALKHHFHALFDSHEGLSKGEMMSQFQFVVVGGGPAGIELAGEIRNYVRMLATRHGVPEHLVTVVIIQGGDRLLPMMPEKVSEKVQERLEDLGINTILGRPVVSQDQKGVHLKDITLNAQTIIWTAGVRPSTVYAKIKGLELDPKGRIIVDEHLRVQEHPTVFVGGDSASTQFAGTAQTAIHDGSFVGKAIRSSITNKPLPKYKPRQNPYVVPAGPGWAILTYKKIVIAGRIIWWLRQLIDLHFFLTILPPQKAYKLWREGAFLVDDCPTCGHLS